jgi:alpha-N-arabinofuranosidase
MASYAPLFANTEAWQWTPDLIWVDSLRLVRTPSYYVQSLFARNRGDRVLPITLDKDGDPKARGVYATAAIDDTTGDVIVKVVNGTAADSVNTLDLKGAGRVSGATWTILQSGDLHDENTIESPDRVIPRDRALSPVDGKLSLNLPPNSFSVIRVRIAR